MSRPQAADREHQLEFGTIVAGGGAAGTVIAGRLAEAGETVLLIEAGPDFGPSDSGHWPERLLDPSLMPVDLHSWDYVNSGKFGLANMPMQRARVIGGCSSHNGCAVVWGHRDDYDAWQAAGNAGWGADELLPWFELATARMRVHTPARLEITPFHQEMLESAPNAGLPSIGNFCDLDITRGLGIGPVNIASNLRWNTAFAYLDPVRDRSNLTILAGSLVDQLVLDGDRVTGVIAYTPRGIEQFHAARVVLAGGAYGSPLILQRSGVGDPEDLAAHGLTVRHALSGVGKNLQDHPAIGVPFTGTPQLTAMLDRFVESGGMPREEGTIALTSSSRCEGPFDLHVYPIAHRNGPGDWDIFFGAAVMAPRSAGRIEIGGIDPEAAPVIDHGYLTDSEGYDLDALCDAMDQIRELASKEPIRSLIGHETGPLANCLDHDSLCATIPAVSVHDYHPTSTCRMGPASDPMAVMDATGKVHGLEGLFIADASIFPAVPWANTNLPTIAAAEKIAAGLIS